MSVRDVHTLLPKAAYGVSRTDDESRTVAGAALSVADATVSPSATGGCNDLTEGRVAEDKQK